MRASRALTYSSASQASIQASRVITSNAPPHAHPLSFGHRLNKQTQKALEEKVQRFSQALNALVTEDTQDTQPVFERVNQRQITQQVKTVLTRQAHQSHEQHPVPMMIGMAGGSNSGKSTVMGKLLQQFQDQAIQHHQWDKERHGPVVDTLELDHYYKNFADTRQKMGDERFFKETNLDEPQALETHLFQRALMKIKNGQAVRAPLYNFLNSSRQDGAALKVPSPFFVFEGLFALAHEPVRKLADLKIFINCDEETRSKRFWARAPQRNIKPDQSGWNLFNKTMAMHNQHVQPTEAFADIVINGARPLPQIESKLTPLASLLVKTLYPTTPNPQEQAPPSRLSQVGSLLQRCLSWLKFKH